MDIKNQYTMLVRSDIYETLLEVRKDMVILDHKVIKVAKDKSEKYLDGFGEGSKSHFWNIELGEIWRYVVFELDTAFIKVGQTLLKQIDGIAMGSMCGAALATLD